LLGEKLAISEESLLKYLGTYILAAAYNLSQNQILKQAFIHKHGRTYQPKELPILLEFNYKNGIH
jgi:hypothetical protein